MTVVPIPVAPTPVETAAPDAGADTEAAPGFANLLDAAQGQDASESTGEAAGDAPANGESSDASGENPANALPDATVLALLAALTGVAPQPVTPEPVAVVDVTAITDADVVATDAETVTAGISLVDGVDAAASAGEPVVVAPAPAPDEAGEPGPAPSNTAPEPAPSTPTAAPAAPAAARPDAAIAAPVVDAPVVDADAAAAPVVVAPTAPQPDAEKPARANAGAFTAATPPVVAPTEARSAAPVAPTAPAAAPAPPVPHEQVVSVLRPLRRVADGTYELRLQLRPPELGQIELRVEMRHGVLHAALQADNPQAVEIMRNGLGELRSRLEAEGVRAGALTVDSNAAQMSQRDRESQREMRESGDPLGAPVENIATVARPATNTDALLDVRI
jgi:flagellar hook-length control protein FliK